MTTKTYKLQPIKCVMETNNFPKGLVLKRLLTTQEARHIMKSCLGINISTIDDCYDKEEYDDYNMQLAEDVNDWLCGDIDDSSIMEYAYDCSDEPLGIFNLLTILTYLQKKEII